MATKYNHAFTVSFSIDTDKPCDPDDQTNETWPTKDELLDALMQRVRDLRTDRDNIYEAIGLPYDTYSFEVT